MYCRPRGSVVKAIWSTGPKISFPLSVAFYLFSFICAFLAKRMVPLPPPINMGSLLKVFDKKVCREIDSEKYSDIIEECLQLL